MKRRWKARALCLVVLVLFARPVAAFDPFEIEDFERPLTNASTGEPIFLKDLPTAASVLPAGGTIFPGGTMLSACCSDYLRNQLQISLVTRTDANTADDVAITHGNQALRISVLNKGNGDGNTSFDRPAEMIFKPDDFAGIPDSRYTDWATVEANRENYTVAIDVTILADEIPDTSASGFNPYLRLGFFSNSAGAFTESPTNILQGPPQLVFSNGDADTDGVPNFSDPQWVDPGNPSNLPGFNRPGVIQRHYEFPASVLSWPAAGQTPISQRADGGGQSLSNAYTLGYVFNGIWSLDTRAAFIVDNIHFIDRNPISAADLNSDMLLNVLDWQILITNLNGPGPKTFAQGDITGNDGLVNFLDFVRFEEIWDANNGAGAFQAFLGGVPEPSSAALVVLGLLAIAARNRRRTRKVFVILTGACIAMCSSAASAQLANTVLFGWEPPPEPNLQRWVPAADATNMSSPPVVTTAAMGATQGSTRGLSITQNGSGFSWDASVGIFGGENGLPAQQAAFTNALDTGANHFVLEMDVVYKDALIPDASFVNLAVRLTAGGASTDEVHSLAVAGDGSGAIPDSVIPVSIPLSIAPISTSDSVLSVPNQASLAGFYNMSLGFNGDWGPASATFFVDNIRLRQVTQPNLLTLEINRTTGAATLKNVPGAGSGDGPVVFDYYEITSASEPNAADYNNNGKVDTADYVIWRKTLNQTVPANTAGDGNGDGMVTTADYELWRMNFDAAGSNPALNPAGWNSLDAQNIDAADGPDAGSVAGDSLLEGWDKSGSPSATVLSEAFLNGNSTWDPNESRPLGNIFTPGGSQNLVLRFREPNRPSFLRTGLVTYVGGSGSSLGSGAAVPEPQSFVLALIPGILALEFRSPRRPERSRSLPGCV